MGGWQIGGQGLGGGWTKVRFSQADRFIFCAHNDGKHTTISLNLDNIFLENHTTILGKSERIKTVEHLFSTLYGLEIFNIRIDLFGDRLPFLDGSSREFARLLVDYPVFGDYDVLVVKSRITVKDCGSYLCYTPYEKGFIVDMTLSHPYIGTQQLVIEITRENYIREIAPARTFVFTDQSDPRLKNPPPYGIGITANGIYSAEPLRFPDEPVRHKILDLLGDLYVLKKRLQGRIKGVNTSHALNLKFIRTLLRMV